MTTIPTPTVTGRAKWLLGIAEQHGYTLGRDSAGRYVLARDGLSKRYMSFSACLEALTTGRGLPEHTARPHVAPPEPTPEPSPPEPLAGYTLLSQGDESGWWLSRGGFCMWFATAERAEWAVKTGNLPELLRANGAGA